jgi:hypothetical protein
MASARDTIPVRQVALPLEAPAPLPARDGIPHYDGSLILRCICGRLKRLLSALPQIVTSLIASVDSVSLVTSDPKGSFGVVWRLWL